VNGYAEEGPAAVRAGFEQLLAALEAAEVKLAAFWVFDLKKRNKTWNVTFDNDRTYMLELTAEANRRWNQAAKERNKVHDGAYRNSSRRSDTMDINADGYVDIRFLNRGVK